MDCRSVGLLVVRAPRRPGARRTSVESARSPAPGRSGAPVRSPRIAIARRVPPTPAARS
jgi:hypothetical protein